jgi:hypothetical protein
MPRSVAGRRSCHPGVSVSRLLALCPTPGNLRRRFALVAETAPPTLVDHARGTTQDYERGHKIEPDHHYLLSESSQRAPDLWRSFGADSHAGAAGRMQARDTAAGPPLWRSDMRPATSAHVTLQATPGKPSHSPRRKRRRGEEVETMWSSGEDHDAPLLISPTSAGNLEACCTHSLTCTGTRSS